MKCSLILLNVLNAAKVSNENEVIRLKKPMSMMTKMNFLILMLKTLKLLVRSNEQHQILISLLEQT